MPDVLMGKTSYLLKMAGGIYVELSPDANSHVRIGTICPELTLRPKGTIYLCMFLRE